MSEANHQNQLSSEPLGAWFRIQGMCTLEQVVDYILKLQRKASASERKMTRLETIIRRTAAVVDPECPDIDAYIDEHCGLPEAVERLKANAQISGGNPSAESNNYAKHGD